MGNFNYECNVYMMLNTTKNMTEILLCSNIEIELSVNKTEVKVYELHMFHDEKPLHFISH